MKNLWSKLILLLGIVILVDSFLFKFLIWNLPNESAWSTNFFFGYEYHWRELKRKNFQKPLVLILGSSIAAYSFHTEELQKALLEQGFDVEVEILSYAGMTPVDTVLLSKKILLLNPKIIIYPINFIDFRIHREMVFHTPENLNWKKDFLLKDTLNYSEAPQSRYSYPLEAVLEFYPILPIDRTAEYLLAELFGMYRYRDLYYENLKLLYQHRFGKNISYHGYCGVQIPEGIDSLGWTGRKFSFLVKNYMKQEGFYVQIVPEILKKGSLTIEFYSSKGQLLQKEIFSSHGWKKIQLQSEIPEGEMVQAVLSDIWFAYEASGNRLDFHRDEMGVRLQQTFGLEFPRVSLQYVREPRKEDYRYENMNEEEYKEYFFYRLLSFPEHRPGIVYFSNIWESKKWTNTQNFEPNPHYEYLLRWKEILKPTQTKMLLINNPENPITLNLYKNSNWYQTQIQFLKQIESEKIKFYDIAELLKPQDFSDYHHLTFPAMLRMNVVYSSMILKELE